MKGEHLVGRVVMVGDPSTTMFVIAIDWVSGVLVRFVGSNPGLVDGTDANRGVVHLSLLNRSSNAGCCCWRGLAVGLEAGGVVGGQHEGADIAELEDSGG